MPETAWAPRMLVPVGEKGGVGRLPKNRWISPRTNYGSYVRGAPLLGTR